MKYNNDNIVDAQWWNITFTQILHLSKFLVTICLSLLSINHSLLVDLDQSEEWAAVSAWKKIFYWVSHARRKKQVHTWKFDFFFFFSFSFTHEKKIVTCPSELPYTWEDTAVFCWAQLRCSACAVSHCCGAYVRVTRWDGSLTGVTHFGHCAVKVGVVPWCCCLYFTLLKYFHFLLLLHYISEANVVLLTPLNVFSKFRYFVDLG